MSSNQVFNLIRSENLTNNSKSGISFEWDADGWLHVHGTQNSSSAWGVTSIKKTPIHLDAGEYFLSAEVEGDTPAAWAPAEGETLAGGGCSHER